jgi:hypothetical protein
MRGGARHLRAVEGRKCLQDRELLGFHRLQQLRAAAPVCTRLRAMREQRRTVMGKSVEQGAFQSMRRTTLPRLQEHIAYN